LFVAWSRGGDKTMIFCFLSGNWYVKLGPFSLSRKLRTLLSSFLLMLLSVLLLLPGNRAVSHMVWLKMRMHQLLTLYAGGHLR